MRLESEYLAVQSLHNEKNYPISALCDVISLNRSSYYKWLCRDSSKLDAKNSNLLSKIIEQQEKCGGILGYRQMTGRLWRIYGIHVNKKRVYRFMRAIGMQSVIRRKRPRYRKSTPEAVAENLLNRSFTAAAINEKWLTDITEFRAGDGSRVYLSAILDIKDKSIVSHTVMRNNSSRLADIVFDDAVRNNPNATPLFHSDRGVQYTRQVFQDKLEASGMIQSMSRVGRCIDNSPMESFWSIIKTEMYHRAKFPNYASLKSAIDEYIIFYNNHRYQEKLGWLAPLELRRQLTTA